jgi:hypothetical protein
MARFVTRCDATEQAVTNQTSCEAGGKNFNFAHEFHALDSSSAGEKAFRATNHGTSILNPQTKFVSKIEIFAPSFAGGFLRDARGAPTAAKTVAASRVDQ